MTMSEEILGESPPIKALRDAISKMAAVESSVLITGETGTGKELVAEALHDNSARRRGALVSINCAAIPDGLLESELFGCEKGAFTGAVAPRRGQLQQAHNGTLFLDEIGEMSLQGQAKILRAIETKRIQPLGGKASVSVNVRVIAATNRNLEHLVAQGKFREDLFYRLNVARLELPPLRDRKGDLGLLGEHFIRDLNPRFGLQVTGFATEALECLVQHTWPGNVREFKNLMEATFINRPGAWISTADFPEWFCRRVTDSLKDHPATEAERDRLVAALVSTHWNKTRAAEKLHWCRLTLYRKMHKYHLMDRELARHAEGLGRGSTTEGERDRLVAALVSTHWNKTKAAKKLNCSRMTLYRKMQKLRIVDPETTAAPAEDTRRGRQ